jgi:hypothetical protein
LISVSFLQFSFSVEFNCKVSIIHTHKARSCSKTLWVRHSYYILFQFKNLCSRNNRSFSYFLTKFVDFKCFFDDDSRLTLQQKTDEVLKSWKTGNSEFSVLFSFFPQKFSFFSISIFFRLIRQNLLCELPVSLPESIELKIFLFQPKLERTKKRRNIQTNGQTMEWKNIQTNERTNEQTNERKNEGLIYADSCVWAVA